MGDLVPGMINFSEEDARLALVESRGDIFVASQMLRVTALRLDRAIRVSEVLQATIETIREAGKSVTEEQIQKAIDTRISIYRVAGLDALHDLATMPIDENSAQNQVKLAAAARLAGGLEHGAIATGMDETLRELQAAYQQSAPRLRVIRERTTTTLEIGPSERVIEQEPKD